MSAEERRAIVIDGGGACTSLDCMLPRVLAMLNLHGHMGVLVMDLEPLSAIEHDCGCKLYDELLGLIRDELDKLRNQVIRATDLVCGIRPNGEQIAVFLEGARTPAGLSGEALERVADRLWHAMAPRIAELTKKCNHPPRFRMGYALLLPNPMIRPERLVYRALDQARSMAVDHSRRVDMRAREQLRDLIVHKRLKTVFQPIIDLSQAAEVHAYEALIRGPEGSELSTPAMLFDLAQHLDLIHELDRACCDMNLTSAAALPPSVLVFANVLPSLLNDSEFREWLLLRAHERYSGRLVLEINEGVAIRNPEMLSKGIDELRRGGVRIAVDDLGSGYSNLDYVARLCPDFLKLDISLVRGVDRSAVKQAMIASLLAVGRAVGATVIAEGIETESERDTLIRLGVPWGQGFLLGRPGPVSC
ncbi:MAG: EAL domain-containing protein [Myxococcales bacterium]|nr:EAL domain-containing protein [Myxococcales bacterium]